MEYRFVIVRHIYSAVKDINVIIVITPKKYFESLLSFFCLTTCLVMQCLFAFGEHKAAAISQKLRQIS